MKTDKFGIIEPDTHQFKSIEEAGNYVKDLKDKLKRKASAEEFPITMATPEDRLKFIEYSVSLMTKKNLPFTDVRKIVRAKSVLWLVAQGYTFSSIANYLKKQGFGNVTIQQIKDVQREGMKYIKECINKVRNSKTPIIAGV